MYAIKKISWVIGLTFAVFLLQCCDTKGSEEIETKVKSDDVASEKIYEESESEIAYDENDEISNSRQNAITTAVKKCSPAIVGINVTSIKTVAYNNPFMDPFFNFFRQRSPYVKKYEVHGLGSGFIISKDGYILTNHHVAGGAKEIIVTLTNGEKYNAEIIGEDLVSDVALLKIDGEEDFPYLELADSKDLIIGEWVIAFGNPFGLFDINAKPTVTVGVVSNHNVDFYQEDNNNYRIYREMIQTDAAISSGNSGGPLVNSRGQVIGMNTVIYSTAQNRQGAGSIGIGFAIPINRVKKIVDYLKEHKSIDRDFYTGMDVRELDEKISKYFGLNKSDGVYIHSIKRSSPADKAGFEPGDIITEINGRPILRPDDFIIAVYDSKSGDVLDVTVLRGEENKKIEFELESAEKYR